ncbi:hypothetical protein [Xanthomonas sacchari]|uniref:Bacterial Pleckstrin homology domain-containing protein n=1 Tax=Xanthomonas sacchari TaxID=56458 RepID=A0ABT3DPT0_9XANT|nr:hypothetical protein [Xanthomonas sacchari]MCW0372126.1 hypothetical protein [Xanthomonas sacchari]MCW0397496.1 hypothetical protein [Xanthomonas sacchari]MCW0418989.1 hypothetical protein [Xanthomonas sacchari]UYK71674.1 hypothetical protein NG828_15770 [Xanthomonas sacchari]
MSRLRSASPSSTQRYPVAPAHRLGLALWLWLPLLLVAAVIGAFALHAARPGALWWHFGLLALIGVVGTATFARQQVLLHDGLVEIRATFLTRRVPLAALRMDAARVVALSEHTGFRPALKLLGFGYPGFHAGYYRTRDGHKAFCLITDDRVLAVPLHDGGWLLLSVEHPRQVLQDWQTRAAQARGGEDGRSAARHMA